MLGLDVSFGLGSDERSKAIASTASGRRNLAGLSFLFGVMVGVLVQCCEHYNEAVKKVPLFMLRISLPKKKSPTIVGR